MLISAQTKIAALIRENPAAIEAIAAINPHFEKLRHPVLRKLLASRVTISDAARIGGTSVAVFFERLQPLGFTTTPQQAKQAAMTTPLAPAALPAFLQGLSPENKTELDVREDISSGNDPFLRIMEAVEAIPQNGALCLINSFEPIPLMAILKKRGYAYCTRQVAADLVHTWFYRPAEEAATGNACAMPAAAPVPDFDRQQQHFAGRLHETDVSQLPMPQPMQQILQALQQLPADHALLVHHRRVPQMLLPQLAEQGFRFELKKAGEEQVQLLIYR